MNLGDNAVHRAWVQREATRCAVARYSVAHWSIAQALASGLSLAVAQRVINWQQYTGRMQ